MGRRLSELLAPDLLGWPPRFATLGDRLRGGPIGVSAPREGRMANKDQKRGNREARKPKQPKAKPVAATSPFVVTGKTGAGGSRKG